MADLKKTAEEVLREAAHTLAEISAQASKDLQKSSHEALGEIALAAKAVQALPVSSSELLAAAHVAFVKDVEVASGSRLEHASVRIRGNDYTLCGFENWRNEAPPLKAEKYRVLLLIIPIK